MRSCKMSHAVSLTDIVYVDGLEENCSISIADVLVILHACTAPSISYWDMDKQLNLVFFDMELNMQAYEIMT